MRIWTDGNCCPGVMKLGKNFKCAFDLSWIFFSRQVWWLIRASPHLQTPLIHLVYVILQKFHTWFCLPTSATDLVRAGKAQGNPGHSWHQNEVVLFVPDFNFSLQSPSPKHTTGHRRGTTLCTRCNIAKLLHLLCVALKNRAYGVKQNVFLKINVPAQLWLVNYVLCWP